jgi:hypothetical protein
VAYAFWLTRRLNNGKHVELYRSSLIGHCIVIVTSITSMLRASGKPKNIFNHHYNPRHQCLLCSGRSTTSPIDY